MATYHVRTLSQAANLFARHQHQRSVRTKAAIRRTCVEGSVEARKNAPRAFGELWKGIRATDHKVVSDAPHSAPVERGSRPHWPPLEPLIRWVKLRGMQALNKRGELHPSKQLKGITSREHAWRIGAQLANMAAAGGQQIEDPEIIARSIQIAIAKRGTKPSWYMRNTVPFVRAQLGKNIREALKDR